MQPRQPTTPFGRRTLTLAHVAAQMAVSSRRPDKVVHKWQIFRAICTARPKLGVSERALAVLNAFLSFHPETTLTGDDELIVFPVQRAAVSQDARHAALDLKAADCGAGGRWTRRSARQSERQALRPEGQGRGRSNLRLVSTSRRSSCAPKSSRGWRRRSRPKPEPSG